jgi:hypothetical protein
MLVLIENAVVYLAFILYKMGVAVSRTYSGMPRKFLGGFYPIRPIDDGNKVVTEIMDTDLLTSPCLVESPLDVVPHITRRDSEHLSLSSFIVAHKDGRGFGSWSGLKVFFHSLKRAIGDMYNGRSVTFPGNGDEPFKQIYIANAQAARLRDTKPAIRQKQNKRSVSEFFGSVAYSIHVINGFAYAVKVQLDEVARGAQSVLIIGGIKESRLDIANSISQVLIELTDRRSIQGLRGWGFVGSLKQEFYIHLFIQWRILTDNAYKLFKSAFVRIARLSPACFIHEVQEGLNVVFCGKDLIWHNANYIRGNLKMQLSTVTASPIGAESVTL